MFKTPWSQKTTLQRIITVGSMIGIFLGCVAIAYAISAYFTSKSYEGIVPKIHTFEIDLTGQTQSAGLGPGDSQTIEPTITNMGTEDMYVFIRINCSDDGIYTFESSGSWTEVTTAIPGEKVYCYGDPIALNPGQSAKLECIMTVAVDNVAYSQLADDALNYTVTGCAIGTDAENSTPATLYSEFLTAIGG